MSTVDQVALWVGLISGIVSIVLSVVAIAFAVMVDRSARAVTAQTIKSLQKIESDVERLSTDTRELIKAGWDRMLSSVPVANSAEGKESSQLASGIAAEIKSELAPLIQSADKTKQAALENRLADIVEAMEASVTRSQRTDPRVGRGANVDRIHLQLEALSPEAIALVAAVLARHRHLEPDQYRQLRAGPLGEAVREVRRAGLLEPQVAGGKSDSDPPVYFFPGPVLKGLGPALALVTAPGQAAENAIHRELQRVGYLSGAV